MAVTLFSYSKGNSIVHKIPPLLKIFFLTSFCIFTFFGGDNIPQSFFYDLKSTLFFLKYAFCFCLPLLLFALSKIHTNIFFELKPVLFITIMVTLFRSIKLFPLSFYEEGFYSGVLYSLRFVSTSLAASVVFKTTSSLQINQAFASLENGIAKIFPSVKKSNPALLLSLTINFIPCVFELWNKINLAAKARRGKKKYMFTPSIIAQEFSTLLSCLLFKSKNIWNAIQNRSCKDS